MKFMRAIFVLCLMSVLPVAAQRQFLVEGHLDINWVFEDGVLFAQYSDEEDNFPPLDLGLNEAVMVAKNGSFQDGSGSRTVRPSSSA